MMRRVTLIGLSPRLSSIFMSVVTGPCQDPARGFSCSNDFWASEKTGGSAGLWESDWAKAPVANKVRAAIGSRRADFIGAFSSESIGSPESWGITWLAKIRGRSIVLYLTTTLNKKQEEFQIILP